MTTSEENKLIRKYMSGSADGVWGYNINTDQLATIWAILQKLLPELRATQREGELESHIVAIEMALLELDITKVFNAVVEAIVQLNKLKEDEIIQIKG